MRVEFKKVILHNFLSFGHSEFVLANKGYCLVNGINNCPLDKSTSNGSGKSTFVSAICWALTGATIQGVTKDIKNIFIDEDLCYVTLDFIADGKHYEVTRYKKTKSDLKILIDGKDESGKGIRESELVLAQHLPDMDKDLISSVILLGQGLPNKLSSFTPSGRKELLEKLSKSDFMIEDVKRRIGDRLNVLNSKIRECDDSLLKHTTLKDSAKNQYDKLVYEKENTEKPDYNAIIKDCNENIQELSQKVDQGTKRLEELEANIIEINKKYDEVNEEKAQVLNEELLAYNHKRDSLIVEKSKIEAGIKALQDEIDKIKAIKDVCPTCGRPFEGVVKPSTEEQQQKILELKSSLLVVDDSIQECNKKHSQYIDAINSDYRDDLLNLVNTRNKCNDECRELRVSINSYNTEISSLEKKIAKNESDRDNEEKYWNNLLSKISNLEEEMSSLTTKCEELTKTKEDIQAHLDVVKKMDTLVKRDFRGYLLSNVIEFIDAKAKEYSIEVFGSNKLDFKLDGNNIDITYCDKSFESLSGGEKQRVDLVLQFAIRDMMSKYLDFSSNVLILDEIFDNLDAMATTNVLNLISNKLTDIDSMFIISHHSDSLNICYDCELEIIKSVDGISSIRHQ